jgi:hypothetical protein
MFVRLKASLLLAPALFLLLCWIGRFAGPEQVMRLGILPFALLSAAVAIAIAYFVTLYVHYLAKSRSGN